VSKRRASLRPLDIALAIVPGVAIALYWLQALAQGDSLSVAAIYRYGDYTYFPALAGLADFSLGESLVLEHEGGGLRSFPFAPLALHGVLLGLLGPIGFAVADVLVAMLAYGVALRLFGICGLALTTRRSLALLVSCALFANSRVAFSPDWLPDLFLWGYRLPRPFLTDLFLMLGVGSWLRIVAHGARGGRDWALLGLWFGLLLQSRFYSAATLGLGIGLGVALSAWRDRRPLARELGAFVLTTAITLIPFLAQRWLEHPDVPVRFGAFAVNRLAPLWIEGRGADVLQGLVACLLIGALLQRARPARTQTRLRALSALALLVLLSPLALPASTLLLGQTVQPYHFLTQVVVFKTIALAVCLGHGLDLVADAVARRRPRWAGIGWTRPAALGLCALVGIAVASVRHDYYLGFPKRLPMIPMDPHRVRDYRGPFAELTRELSSARYADAAVLGTLDIQVHAWWSLFGGGHVFLPDPFATSLPDEAIEDRVLDFLHLHGVAPRRLPRILQDRELLVYFLSCNKYQASSAHTFAPLSEYPEQLRAAIHASSVFDSWKIALPPSEARRLIAKYVGRDRGGDGPRLDVIVLGRSGVAAQLEPDPEAFELSFRNRVFRVYTRRLM
jgi:hypothetical protein